MRARALKASGGNVSEAARRLGIPRMAMRYRMDKYGLRGAEGETFVGYFYEFDDD